MKTKEFLSQLDEAEIVSAIAEAERRTSGEIRVFVSQREVEDALKHAKARFLNLGMQNTRKRNGVLIYLAPACHKFAVVGDVAVHEKCGARFWGELTGLMGHALREQRFTEAIVLAVRKCGALLEEHFPAEPGDENELPDRIETEE